MRRTSFVAFTGEFRVIWGFGCGVAKVLAFFGKNEYNENNTDGMRGK